ncbi:MAG: CobD/CbiB family protein [Betaproteobacteria bacterium]|nr:MAG: CobD/CbiB family protein [Betaproteobacteria bacterium]
MSLISLIIALLLEQWRPLADRKGLVSQAVRFADFLQRHFNAGERTHGIIAWLLGVVPAMLLAILAYYLLYRLSPFLALAFNVLILYVTMGFRHVGHYFTDIHWALKSGDLERARAILGEWRGSSCERLNAEEVARLTIEDALAASYRHVFAVVFWFVLLPGPIGAILYRLSAFLNQRWANRGDTELAAFGDFASQIVRLLDWIPARLTAIAFAIVGDFEDAAYCWRTQAAKWPDAALGVVLASGAGAMGVRLGMPFQAEQSPVDRPELGLGDDADVGFLDSTIGLVWRALVVILCLLLLLAIARAMS